MDNQDKNKQDKSKAHEELRNSIAEILRDSKKKELESFVMSLDPMMKKVDEVINKGEENNIALKLNMYRHKIALITFNGVLLALMVGSKDKISFGLFTFSLLFFSIAFGLLQVIIYYFKNEYDYLDGTILQKKMQAISNLCKNKIDDENVINDAKSFLRTIVLESNKSYDSVPALLKDMNETHNLPRKFIGTLLYELIFFIPFLLGIGVVIYKVCLYVS